MEKHKMSYSTADNSAVSKDRAARFALLERANGAANSSNVDFSTYGYSPVPQPLNIIFLMMSIITINQPFFNRFQCSIYQNDGLTTPELTRATAFL
jgi:hypothetical protein